jgi:hypothetical protein
MFREDLSKKNKLKRVQKNKQVKQNKRYKKPFDDLMLVYD